MKLTGKLLAASLLASSISIGFAFTNMAPYDSYGAAKPASTPKTNPTMSVLKAIYNELVSILTATNMVNTNAATISPTISKGFTTYWTNFTNWDKTAAPAYPAAKPLNLLLRQKKLNISPSNFGNYLTNIAATGSNGFASSTSSTAQLLSKYSALNAMDYSFQGSQYSGPKGGITYSFNPSQDLLYTNSVVEASTNYKNDQASNQFAAISAIHQALVQIRNSYMLQKTPPPAGESTTTAPISYTPNTSRMDILYQTIQTPFSKTYTTNMAAANSTQALKAIARLTAETNLLKYQVIKLTQAQNVLQANLLSQQMQTNSLLRQLVIIETANAASNKKTAGASGTSSQ